MCYILWPSTMVVLIATLLSLIAAGWMTAAILTFLWHFVLVIAAVWTTAIDLLIAICCFVVSLPSSFNFPSNSKQEKTHTLFHSLSLSVKISFTLKISRPQLAGDPLLPIELAGDRTRWRPKSPQAATNLK